MTDQPHADPDRPDWLQHLEATCNEIVRLLTTAASVAGRGAVQPGADTVPVCFVPATEAELLRAQGLVAQSPHERILAFLNLYRGMIDKRKRPLSEYEFGQLVALNTVIDYVTRDVPK